ncbi:MAG: hypothetical protein IPP66_11685 [Anaerolineales bacterium]|nr:hypothetical protein [Anaerolineales bacterium]
MKKGLVLFILLATVGTLFVLPNFYRNRWNAVDVKYYEGWQTQYDRFVIARLVKTRQDGFFSASGFMGLGDVTELNFLSATNRHQLELYLNNGKFQSYEIYRSNPGFQGILYGTIDKLLNISNNQKLKIFRGLTALLSATGIGILFAAFAIEFGILAGLLMLFFAVSSIWLVLPAGSIFWNLWAIFLPFLASIYVLTESTKRGYYNATKLHILLFFSTLLRILLSGFDVITTGMLMTTVPFVFYGIKENWGWKTFFIRSIKGGFSILAGVITGLLVMSTQIILDEGNTKSAISYILNRLGHHAEGNSKIFTNPEIKATKISAFEILGKYLNMPALTLQAGGMNIVVLYWHLVVMFAIFTIIYLAWNRNQRQYPLKATALIVSTWYSICAPFSWYLLFRPHSIIHTHVNTMGWQMPFTLLGFVLCGYVLTDLFKRKTV